MSENERLHLVETMAFAHVGALLSLLAWWVDRGMRQTPAEMDQLFHKMVWQGMGA